MEKHPKAILQEWCQQRSIGLPQYVDFIRPQVSDEPQFSCIVGAAWGDYHSDGHFSRKKDAQTSAAMVAIADLLPQPQCPIQPSRPRAPPTPKDVDCDGRPNCYVFVDCDGCGDIWKTLYDATPAPYARYIGYGNMRVGNLPHGKQDENFTLVLAETMRRDIAEYMLARDVWKLVSESKPKSPLFRIIVVSKDAAVENLVVLLKEENENAYFACTLERLYDVFDS